MILNVTLALFATGEYGEFIWPSYIISIGALAILAILSWRRKQAFETRLNTLENQGKKTK